jgi:hypothetical protein
MNVLFILRNNKDAKFIISNLGNLKNTTVKIVLENGMGARARKVKRMLKGSFLHRIKVITLDLPSILLFDIFQQRMMWSSDDAAMKNVLYDYTEISSVNDGSLIKLVDDLAPDLILSYGTSIYSKSTLDKLNNSIINLHSGLLPRYRNVHTDFWAYKQKDFEGIGVTAFKVDEGIDSGETIKFLRTRVKESDFLWEVKLKNLQNIVNLSQLLIGDDQKSTDLPGVGGNVKVQLNDNEVGKFWPTPDFFEILKYFSSESKKKFGHTSKK